MRCSTFVLAWVTQTGTNVPCVCLAELSTSDTPPQDSASAGSDQWRPDMPKGVLTTHPQAVPAPSDWLSHLPSSSPSQSVAVAAAVVPLQAVKEDLQQHDGVAGPNTQPVQSGAAEGSGGGHGAGNGTAAGTIPEGAEGQGSQNHSEPALKRCAG